MAKPQTEPRSTWTRLPRLRRSAPALAVAAALSAGSAQAVQVISITDLATTQYTWDSGDWYDNTDPDNPILLSADFYDLFARTCPNAGGSACGSATTPTVPLPDNGSPRNPQVLFSWGLRGDDTLNSRARIVNNTGSAFTLDRLGISSDGAVGTGIAFSKGAGAAPAWEWALSAFGTLQSEAIVSITLPSGGTPESIESNLFSGGDVTWYETGDTAQTPVNLADLTIGATNRVIGAGQSIELRLFETAWQGTGPDGGLPDLVFAPFTLSLGLSPVASPNLSVNDLLFYARVGAPAANTTATATVVNSGDGDATNVTFGGGPGGSGVTPTDPLNVGTVEAADPGSDDDEASRIYTATSLTATDFTQTDLGDVLVSYDGGTDLTVDVLAQGVGPVFDLSGGDVSGTTINLGDITLGGTVVTDLVIANLFGTQPGQVAGGLGTDLTRLSVSIPALNVDGSALNDGTGVLTSLGFDVDFEDKARIADNNGQEPFQLQFTSDGVGSGVFNWLMRLSTDQGAAYNGAGTSFEFTVTGRVLPASIPGTLLLSLVGLVGLAMRGRGAGGARG